MSLIEIKQTLSGRERAVFTFAWIALFGGFATWQALGESRLVVALGLAIVAALLPLGALVNVTFVDRVYRGLAWITSPIGWCMSQLALAMIFFLVLAPIGCFRRLLGYDPMRRRFEPERESYWESVDEPTSSESYFKPF